MPTLHWIGKDKVINHHMDVPFKVLERKYSYELGVMNDKLEDTHHLSLITPNSSGAIIHGDNLEALKALLPEYEGRIDCIYIDPPYNTGNETWVYNDNVNDPKIKKWLGQVVGKESEDLSRHDKWLCMMYPRLKLLHKLLKDESGTIFISIDDNELANLKVIMDEIFGVHSFIEYFSWIKTSTPPSLARKSRKTTEYVLCYEKKKTNRKYKAEEGDGGDAPLLNSGNAVVELTFPKDSLFFKIDDGVYSPGQYDRLTLNNEIEITDGYSDKDIKLSGEFKWTQDTLNDEITNGTSFIIKSEKFAIRYLRETETYKAPTNLLKEKYFTPLVDKKDAGVETNEGAKKEILDIFGKNMFDYPKPSSLVEFFLKFMDNKNGIVLDSFAGSGTTAHAVLNLNKQDGGNRKFILVEMEDYAETITAERVKRVIKKMTNDDLGVTNEIVNQKSKIVNNLCFDFYELGQPMFLEDGNLNELVGEERIRQYVYYTETKQSLTNDDLRMTNDDLGLANDDLRLDVEGKSRKSKIVNPKSYLGKHNDTAYYFHYEQDEVTTLDHAFLATMKTKAEQYVIYADNCLLTKNFMTKHNIIFKKIPRDITRF